MNEW